VEDALGRLPFQQLIGVDTLEVGVPGSNMCVIHGRPLHSYTIYERVAILEFSDVGLIIIPYQKQIRLKGFKSRSFAPNENRADTWMHSLFALATMMLAKRPFILSAADQSLH
jgi:hypothetical protein